MDWSTVASLATAAGTLVLAIATFAAVRSGNRSARIAERALLAGLRPLLVPTRFQDPPEKIGFVDGHYVKAEGGRGVAEVGDGVVYLAIPVRNVGTGLGVLHGWLAYAGRLLNDVPHAEPSAFRRLTRDLYVPPGDTGFWQGALRDPGEAVFTPICRAIRDNDALTVDLLYGDNEGGQRMVTRFALLPHADTSTRLAVVSRHWNLDRPDPR
jgi:hypothetical protein